MALPCWQARVPKTRMVAEFTVEELKVLEAWVREQVGEVKLKFFCAHGSRSL